MQIYENVSLKLHSTMRLGGTARYCCTVTSEDELLEAIEFASAKQSALRAIGSGSNIIWRDEGFSGLLIIIAIMGYELAPNNTVRYGAGVLWDDAVKIAVDNDLSGIESLSLIPGTVGATPIQNVGAYGSEVKDTIVSVRAFDTHQKKFVELTNEECRFAYRMSRFKSDDSGRFIITAVTFQLSEVAPKQPFYESLQSYFDTNAITTYTPQQVRDAVIAIRSSKLPDPKKIANNGSFFANPIIEEPHLTSLLADYPTIKYWPLGGGRVKVAAGWLVEHAGFKDYHDPETGMATWHNQSIVLINEHATSASQLLIFKQKIVSAVHDKFTITLEQEPELLP